MKKLFILLIAISLFSVCSAKNNGVKTEAPSKSKAHIALVGKVIDSNTNEALVGVEVKLEGTDIKAYTDFDGNFSIKNVQPGEYNIIASYISYNKSYIEKLSVTNKNNQVNIKLQSSN